VELRVEYGKEFDSRARPKVLISLPLVDLEVGPAGIASEVGLFSTSTWWIRKVFSTPTSSPCRTCYQWGGQ